MKATDPLTRLYTPAQVAQIFAVDPKTVTRWTKIGKLTPATVTPGGHRRYDADEVDRMFRNGGRP